MKDEMFAELVAGVRESGKILRGEVPPARRFLIGGTDVVNGTEIKCIRENDKLSQGQLQNRKQKQGDD